MTTTTAARHSSASNEHYTPPKIVEAARALLGGRIDLDPASSAKAQKMVRAGDWFGLDHPNSDRRDGLCGEWEGTVFLNPPGGTIMHNGKHMSSQKAWWQKLVREYTNGNMPRGAVFVCFSVELFQTSQVDNPPVDKSGRRGLLPTDFPICFPSRRIAYLRPDGTPGKSPPHSSCIVYLPRMWRTYVRALADLRNNFGWLGVCK